MFAVLCAFLLVEIPAFAWAVRRSGFLPFPHVIMVYLIGCQIALWATAAHIIEYNFLRLYSSYTFETELPAALGIFAAFYFGCLLCVPSRKWSLTDSIRGIKIGNWPLIALIALLYLRAFALAPFMDWSLVWSNTEYLTMGGARILSHDNPVTITLISLQKLFGLLACAVTVLALVQKKRWAVALLAPIATWHVLYELAAHSRIAVLYFGVLAILLLVLSRRRAWAVIAVAGAALALLSSLGGRGSGHHGFSSLPEIPTNIVYRLNSDAIGTLDNVFEGAFVTSEVLGLPFTYDTKYKVLSLSPMLSFMDGFASIREQYEHDLGPVVPVSAIQEIASFGAIYCVIFFGVQLISGRIVAVLLVKRPGLAAAILNCVVLLGAYVQFTYSVRTVFRFFFYPMVIGAYLLYVKSDPKRPRRGRRRRVFIRPEYPQASPATLSDSPTS